MSAMNETPCDRVADRLPELVRGTLDTAVAAAVRAHTAACGACAAELRVVERVYETVPALAVPAGLEAHVLGGIRARTAVRPGRASAGRMAMAAAVVLALVTAGVLMRGGGPGTPAVELGDLSDARIWSALDEPLTRAAPSLQDLSVEELERLLEELDS
jgi:anti-sigma factor RsiW